MRKEDNVRLTLVYNLTDAELINHVANMPKPSALELELALRLEQLHDRLLAEVDALQGGADGDDT